MSYNISLCDPVTHKPLKADSTHFIAGGMRAMGGTKELWLNVTYNYSHFYYRPEVFGRAASAPSMVKQAQRASRCLKRPFLH